MFADGNQGRVPTAVIARGRETRKIAQAVSHILQDCRRIAAVVTEVGAYIGDQTFAAGGNRTNRAIRSALSDPRVELLIRSVPPQEIVRSGLLHDVCDVAALVPGKADNHDEEVQQGHMVLLRATRGKVIIGTDNEAAMRGVREIEPNRVIMLCTDIHSAIIIRHLESGGCAAGYCLDDGKKTIKLMQGNEPILTSTIDTVQRPSANTTPTYLDHQLFAVSIAFGLGLEGTDIASALNHGVRAP